jgi:Xaa-Pro aminopeptidase
MFQSFAKTTDSSLIPARVASIRQLIAKGGLDALLVPRSDEHMSEYVAPSAERLAWLTGFTGSAGLAIVGRKQAALFVDGRYTVQVRSETDTAIFELPDLPRGRIAEWLREKLPKGAAVGFDPWLHTASEIAQLKDALAPAGIRLKATPRNLVDRAWGADRPASPTGRISVQAVKHAGRAAADKIADVQARLKKDGQDAAVLTLPDSIAWLFNIRGRDVAHNPVPLAFAVLPASGKPELFVAAAKIDASVRTHLEPLAKLSEPRALLPRLKALRTARKRVRLDAGTAAFAIQRALGGAKAVAKGGDPIIGMKAVKTTAEIAGARNAHIRDGAAVVRFLAWLDGEAKGLDSRARDGLDEIAIVEQLERFRHETEALKEISFDTISGSGPNGAIVHYRVSQDSNRRLKPGELLLLDSGAQYVDGTTDITRTIAIGEPSAEMRRRFTLVLKGHIAIARARFPKGTRGIDLDPLARRALWEAGLDYDHGTGHGIGSYLSVHEGPQSISRAGMAVLEPGMLISNEPGYYKTGAYGIRIENVVLVTEPETPPGGERPMMAFETLTLVPIDLALVARELLTPDEIDWLDRYHARVRKTIGPELDAATRSWLAQATRALA